MDKPRQALLGQIRTGVELDALVGNPPTRKRLAGTIARVKTGASYVPRQS